MQFPESWLRHFCNPPLSTNQLAETLTMAGLEVESLQSVAPPFTGVVIGRIVDVQPHPDAERLKVCIVDVGDANDLRIVCGAPNARIGLRVPCALIGAELPNPFGKEPFYIKLGNLRGVSSEGMLCSAKELGLEDDQAGLMELEESAPLGVDIRKYLVLDDVLFTLKLTPNLAHCLSVMGVARELSALTSTPMESLDIDAVQPTHDDGVVVTVIDTDLCGRFSGRVIRNIDFSAKTPKWMIDRLVRCGQRSVNPLVDISNYVMFEMGQPTHIFDLKKIKGNLFVRWAQAGERLKLLNGDLVQLDSSVGIIADEKNVESLAGIMGGDATAVSIDTQHVYIESAFWWPKAVAGRSRRYNFSTDAGHRFERGVDPSNTVVCLERITQLILDICGGEAGVVDDQKVNMPVSPCVCLRVSRAERVLGVSLSLDDCSKALRGLGLNVVEGVDELTVIPPSHRFDLQIEEDLIEEIARVVGYENLPNTLPSGPVIAKLPLETSKSQFLLRRKMVTMGYQETINFSFVDESWETQISGNTDPVRLLNPIAKHMSVMRSSILGSLLNIAKYNIDRRSDRLSIFEIGRVFFKDESVVDGNASVAGLRQPQRLAGLMYGKTLPLHWEGESQRADFFTVKRHVEALLMPKSPVFEVCEHSAFHPGRCASINLNGRLVGYVGELHPKWRQSWNFTLSPVMFEIDLDVLTDFEVPKFTAFTKKQPVERDIAVWVQEAVTHDQLLSVIRSSVPVDRLINATLFDIYRSKPSEQNISSEKSMAIRLTLYPVEAITGEQDDVDGMVSVLAESLLRELNARLRSS